MTAAADRDFLKFFFEDAEKLFDMERGFQFLDKELEQLFPTEEIEAPKFVDKLVKVFTKTGEEDWILVHIEVQGYDDKDFAKRMFTYFYRILDKYGKPVTAIAILQMRTGNFILMFMNINILVRKLFMNSIHTKLLSKMKQY